MMKRLHCQLAFLLSLALVQYSMGQGTYDLLIKNVQVVDVKKGVTRPAQNVCIKGDRIAAVFGPGKSNIRAKNTIDGKGKFLIPGLWDMHTHNWWQLHFSNHYVANGVLGVRNMYTPMSMVKPVRDSIDKNLLPGPRYVAAGRVIEGPGPEFPDWLVVDSVSKIKAALDTLQAEGSDFVKVYNKIPRAVYFELVKAAHKRGMRVEGHLPMAVSAIEASNAGQRSFEHLLGIPDLCTRDSLFRNKYKYNWFAAVMNEDDYGTLRIDDKIAAKNLAVLKKNHTYVCPTLVVWYSYCHPDTLFEKDRELEKLPGDMVGFWAEEIGKYRKKEAAYKQMALRKYENLKKVTALLYRNGVPMIAGTDAINPYCYPGYSLHRELELLRECGIPEAEILRMATSNAADFLKLKDHGQVKPGFVASLVLLDKNPLSDIRNTKAIHAVILKGSVFDKAALAGMRQ